MDKISKLVILDSVIIYPEHRNALNSIAKEVVEYPSSLPDSLERQYRESPELFKNIRCYTEIGTNDTPLQLLQNRIDGADVIVSCWTSIPDEILMANSQLRLVIFWTHEKEHRINVELANELGISVTNIPDYGTDSVAELIFAGIYKLLEKNHNMDSNEMTEEAEAQKLMSASFDYFRKLSANEKNTRSGKFTHHFHKLGLAKFDFQEKDLQQMIPERLVEGKKIGLLNIPDSEQLRQSWKAFAIDGRSFPLTDTDAAEFYKFVVNQDLIFYDSKNISPGNLRKLEIIAAGRIININDCMNFSYPFRNKVFGVVGLGRIGQKAARIAKGLGFDILYYSNARNTEIEHELGIDFAELEEVMRRSDIISLHVPAHKADGLITKELIGMMKQGAMFINTADGNAVDQTALAERMASNSILAFLDVYPGLPRKDVIGLPLINPSDWKIRSGFDRHVLSYRAGWKTQESIRIKTWKMIGQIIDYQFNNSN